MVMTLDFWIKNKLLIHWQLYIVLITNENKDLFTYNFGFLFLYSF